MSLLFPGKIQFEVNPLDVGITQMLFQLTRDCTECQNTKSGRELFSYSFQSKDPSRNIAVIDLHCFLKGNGITDRRWCIEIVCRDRHDRLKKERPFEGTDQELTLYLKTQHAFIVAKKLALSFK